MKITKYYTTIIEYHNGYKDKFLIEGEIENAINYVFHTYKTSHCGIENINIYISKGYEISNKLIPIIKKDSEFIKDLKTYLKNTPKEDILKEWDKTKKYDGVGLTVKDL